MNTYLTLSHFFTTFSVESFSHEFSEEALKLIMSFGLAVVEFGSCSAAAAAVRAVKPGESWRLAVPALLFVLQNAANLSVCEVEVMISDDK